MERRAEVKSGAWRLEVDLRHPQTIAELITGKPMGCREMEEARPRPRHWMALAEEKGGGGWAEPAATKTNWD